MDIATALGSVFAAFGLSGAAGLNAWIPLLATALLARAGVLDLAEPYDILTTTPALLALGAALVLDFVGDKIPAVDHALHAVGTVVHPVAGAIVFAGQTGVATEIPPPVAWLAGAIVSGSLHGGRAALRPASTATTGGVGNPILSLAEDTASASLTAVALLLPVLAFAAVIGLFAAIAVAWRRMRGRRAAPRGG